MGCGCIPAPPEFDLPEPPDPSLVWNLLAESGESLLHFQKVQLQTCAYNPLFGFLDNDNYYLPALLCICFVVIAIGCLVSACVYRCRRQKRSKCLTSSVNTSKTNSGTSDDTSGGDAHWSPSYNSGINLSLSHAEYMNGPQDKLVAKLYGSSNSSANNLFHAQPIMANTKQGALIRTLPKRTLSRQLGPQPADAIRLHPKHFPSQYCLNHGPIVENPLDYCTLKSQQQPQYEEIGSVCLQHNYTPHYASNPICCEPIAKSRTLLQRQDSDTIFEDLSENLKRQERRPPPASRPPPPPNLVGARHYQQVQLPQRPHQGRRSNSSSSVTDELGSASDAELEQLAQLGVPLPIEVLNVRQQSANDLHGRESGYGTGSKARMQINWHSPSFSQIRSNIRSPPQSFGSSHSSQHNSPPSNSVPTLPVRLIKPNSNNPEVHQQNMTYV